MASRTKRGFDTPTEEHIMPFDTLRSARSLLLIDAVTCAVMGALLALGADALATLTRIPSGLLLYAGLSLLPIAAFMAVVATRAPIQPVALWLIIAGNGMWVIASLALVVSGWITPNPLGTTLIITQALIVAVLAKLEHGTLRGARLQPRTNSEVASF